MAKGPRSGSTFSSDFLPLCFAACSYNLISYPVIQYLRSMVLKILLIILSEAGLVSFQTSNHLIDLINHKMTLILPVDCIIINSTHQSSSNPSDTGSQRI
jgi:hypothetical protein